MRSVSFIAALTALALPVSITAQAPTVTPVADTTAKDPNSDLPLKPTRTVKFTTDEGTWMDLEVSPDGRTILFDLVGDIYTVPITGGKATRLTSGMPFDVQPRYSPDGKSIAFVSDRNGSDNLWIMDADGRNPRGITKMERRQFLSPEWTPDGKYIVVSRNAALFTTQYDLFLYHKDGGSGVKMTGNNPPTPPGTPNFGPPVPNNYVGAAFGKDGRYVYAATRLGGAGGYNQTSFGWQISVYDRETGQVFLRTNALGGALRPALTASISCMRRVPTV
jgi:dipeptidyl aminopeptidase/acylaminoacyl peptidase